MKTKIKTIRRQALGDESRRRSFATASACEQDGRKRFVAKIAGASYRAAELPPNTDTGARSPTTLMGTARTFTFLSAAPSS